jgi:hypothetical protein
MERIAHEVDCGLKVYAQLDKRPYPTKIECIKSVETCRKLPDPGPTWANARPPNASPCAFPGQNAHADALVVRRGHAPNGAGFALAPSISNALHLYETRSSRDPRVSMSASDLGEDSHALFSILIGCLTASRAERSS